MEMFTIVLLYQTHRVGTTVFLLPFNIFVLPYRQTENEEFQNTKVMGTVVNPTEYAHSTTFDYAR